MGLLLAGSAGILACMSAERREPTGALNSFLMKSIPIERACRTLAGKDACAPSYAPVVYGYGLLNQTK